MIEVKNLTKRYGQTTAVNGVSFTINTGEIVGFLGPNGAGKTTTIRILTCFMPATSGQATVAGHDVFSESHAVRQTIGYLPESTPLYPEMRVREYLAFRGKLRDMDHQRLNERIGYVSERCWLSDVINRPIGQLSKGFRQRVGLAEAMLHDPQVLILDEPTVGLDPSQIRETRRLIRELAEDHTVMLSSHILPEVEAVCQRTIIIASGRIVASGSPEELKERIRGDSKLIAEVKAAKPQAIEALQGLDGVHNIEATEQDGWVRLAIDAGNVEQLREQVFSTVSQRGWSLRELRLEMASLEDFFVRVVADQDRESAA